MVCRGAGHLHAAQFRQILRSRRAGVPAAAAGRAGRGRRRRGAVRTGDAAAVGGEPRRDPQILGSAAACRGDGMGPRLGPCAGAYRERRRQMAGGVRASRYRGAACRHPAAGIAAADHQPVRPGDPRPRAAETHLRLRLYQRDVRALPRNAAGAITSIRCWKGTALSAGSRPRATGRAARCGSPASGPRTACDGARGARTGCGWSWSASPGSPG